MPGVLLHSAADITRWLLIDLGYGTRPTSNQSWPIYVNIMNDTPDDIVVVRDTGILHQGRVHVTGEVQEREALQLLVRCSKAHIGSHKMKQIADALDTVVYRNSVRVDTDDYVVHSFSRSSGPIFAGTETPESKRYVWTLNGSVSVRMS